MIKSIIFNDLLWLITKIFAAPFLFLGKKRMQYISGKIKDDDDSREEYYRGVISVGVYPTSRKNGRKSRKRHQKQASKASDSAQQRIRSQSEKKMLPSAQKSKSAVKTKSKPVKKLSRPSAGSKRK